jgi:hypothetical protein
MTRKTLRGLLAGALLLFAWLGLPGLWQWGRNPAPVTMAFEDYLNQGARPDWVVLQGVYVDNLHRVQTVMESRGQSPQSSYAYLPLRLGPEDVRPVKVFLRPNSYVSGPRVAILGRKGESPMDLSTRGNMGDKESLQEVHAVRLLDLDAGSDVRGALRAGSTLPTDPEVIVLEQNRKPMGGHQVPVLLLFCGLTLGLGATFLGGEPRPT